MCPCSPCSPSFSSVCPCCSCAWCDPKHEVYDFYNSQWQKVPRVRIWYIIYRAIIFALFITILCISIGLFKANVIWLVYFIHWALLACCLQALIGLILTTYAYLRQDKYKSNEKNTIMMPCFGSYVYWELFLIGINEIILVSILYWALAYKSDTHAHGKNFFASILVHGVSSGLMLLDLFIVRLPIKMWSSIWALIFYVGYIIFLIIFHVSGGEEKYKNAHVCYSYKIFNGDKPVYMGLFMLIGFLIGIAIHFVVFGLYLLRKCIYKTVFLAAQSSEMDEPKSISAGVEDAVSGVAATTRQKAKDLNIA